MADSSNNSNGQNGSARWAGVVVTVVLAAGAMTVQWGVVTTKLQQVEKRLDEFIGEGGDRAHGPPPMTGEPVVGTLWRGELEVSPESLPSRNQILRSISAY